MFNDLSFKDMINQLDSETKIKLDYIMALNMVIVHDMPGEMR